MAQGELRAKSSDVEEANNAGRDDFTAENAKVPDANSTAFPASIDIEKQAQSSTENDTASEADQRYLVKWDGPDDPANPYNWSNLLRWTVTVFTSFGGFVTLMSGSMIAPALPAISNDLHMSETSAQLALSIFILAFGFGPMILAPFTEIYGRRPVWMICGVFYSIWNIVCGFSPNAGTLIASRLLSGLGGSVDFVIAYPVRSDVWRPEDRGKAFAIASFIPLLGPALGPLLGGVITQSIGWRWLFWVAAIFNGCLVLLGIFLFPETSAARILGDKAKTMSNETGEHYYTEYESPNTKLSDKLKMSITRPTRLLLTQPILQLVSIFMAISFGILYIVLSTFSSLFTDRYHQTISQSGLNYLALAVGYLFASQVGGKATDMLWAHLKKKAGGSTAPEYRVPLLIPGGLLIPIGLFWYGWSAEAQLHWIMIDIGAAIFGCGFILQTNAMGTYILDAFEKYTASATAASQVLRMIAGFAFPIFAPAMYNRLGWGWANSTLAFLSLVSGLLAPAILWTFGARIRAMGKPQW